MLIAKGGSTPMQNNDSLLVVHGEGGFLAGVHGVSMILSALSSEGAHVPIVLPDRISEILARLSIWIRVEALFVFLYNGVKESLDLMGFYAGGIQNEAPAETHRVGEHLTGKAFADGVTVVCNDISTDPNTDKVLSHYWEGRLPSGHLRNAVFIPFSTEFECRGVFRVFNRLDHSNTPIPEGFSQEDVKILEIISQAVGLLVELAWEKQHLTDINNATSKLTSASSIKELALVITQAATRVANSPCAALYFLGDSDPEHLYLAGLTGFSKRHKSLERFPIKSSISGRVATTGVTEFIQNLLTDPGVANRKIAEEENLQSCVAVPAQGSSLRGCLAVFSRNTRVFHRTTIKALENLGLVAGNLAEIRQKTVQISNLTQQLAMAGHSVRNPLQGIANMANEIRSIINGNEPPSETIPLINELFAELERANRRIDSMLYAPQDIINIIGLHVTNVRIPNVIESCVARHQPHARSRGIKIIMYDSIRRLPQVRGDAEKLDLLFDNLLENAIKYSWSNQSIEIRGEHNSAEVCISVTDKGLGIPEEYYEDVFAGFWRSPILDQTRYIAGTGLGLRIVKIISEAHGGSVKVRSKAFLADPLRTAKYEGYETTFLVTIPMQKGERQWT